MMNRPSDTVPCKFCGKFTPMTGTMLCDGCWELEKRLPRFIESPQGRAHVLEVLGRNLGLQAKAFEVRDAGTFMPMLAVQMASNNVAEDYLLGRAGYLAQNYGGNKYVLFMHMEGGACAYEALDQLGTTRQVAHAYIAENFDSLEPGAVIDVEFIRGITKEPKKSERLPR